MTLNIASYGSTRTACEFLTGIAYAMEVSGGLNQEMSDRIDEVVRPVRSARDWLWYVGQLMGGTKPLPEDFDRGLEAAQSRALDALPKFKELIGEACDTLVMTTRALGPAGEGKRVSSGIDGLAQGDDPRPAETMHGRRRRRRGRETSSARSRASTPSCAAALAP